MSLDVFLSFRRCPKHPNIPPFHLGTPIALFGNPEITGGYARLREIDLRFRGAKTE